MKSGSLRPVRGPAGRLQLPLRRPVRRTRL